MSLINSPLFAEPFIMLNWTVLQQSEMSYKNKNLKRLACEVFGFGLMYKEAWIVNS